MKQTTNNPDISDVDESREHISLEQLGGRKRLFVECCISNLAVRLPGEFLCLFDCVEGIDRVIPLFQGVAHFSNVLANLIARLNVRKEALSLPVLIERDDRDDGESLRQVRFQSALEIGTAKCSANNSQDHASSQMNDTSSAMARPAAG